MYEPDRFELLQEQLAHTQDRVMALQAQVRVLVHCLVTAQVVTPAQVSMELTQAMRQIHRFDAGKEFPGVHRAMGVLRAWVESSEVCGPPPAPRR